MMSKKNSARDNPQSSIYADYDYQLKIVLVGETSVGKSSIIMRYSDNIFDEKYQSTLGVDFWDTAGQERFRSISNAYYKSANAIIIVFDKTNMNSFKKIPDWIEQISEYADVDPLILLLGNKNDEFVSELGIKYYDVSAKDSQNVENVFMDIVHSIEYQNQVQQEQKLQSLANSQKLNQQNMGKNQEEDNCCNTN